MIEEWKFPLLLRHFALDLTASDADQLIGLSRRSVTSIFLKIRERIAAECERASPFSSCEVEVDESYFGERRLCSKSSHGASGKTIVFGIFKRNGCVYTEVVPNCKKATLQAIIRGRVSLGAVINSDGWRGYDGLVDVGYAKHFRVHHGENEFARGDHHVNGIESFGSYAKQGIQKFNVVLACTFYLNLKECENRFNHRSKNLYYEMLRMLREHPLPLA
jgi:transposase-like protein